MTHDSPARWVPPSSEDFMRLVGRIEAEPEQAALVDCRASLERLGGDTELFCDLLEFYFRDLPPILASMKAAAVAGEPTAVANGAHRVKGLASGFDARRATATAQELEKLGRSGSLEGAAQLIERLEQEIAAAGQVLARFRV